jgi:hypothetical protein
MRPKVARIPQIIVHAGPPTHFSNRIEHEKCVDRRTVLRSTSMLLIIVKRQAPEPVTQCEDRGWLGELRRRLHNATRTWTMCSI